MSPERANICVIDDTKVAIAGIESIIRTSDHKVVLTAQSKEDALRIIDQFNDLDVDVVLLDTYLTFDKNDVSASQEIMDKIRTTSPRVKIITLSSNIPLEGGDLRLSKNFSRAELIEIINEL